MQKSEFKFHISGFTFLSVLYLLTAVLCLPARAADSWLVDGRALHTLEVHFPDYDTRYVEKVGLQTIVVDVGSDAQANGTALLAAYTQAKSMGPTASNEITLILAPAVYDLGGSTLIMDTEYIHIEGGVPVTLTIPGEVQFAWENFDEILDTEIMLTNTACSAVLSGERPGAIIRSSDVAISNQVSNTRIAGVEISGKVYTSGGSSALWKDVWFSGSVDRTSDTSNTFIRVYAPSGICITESLHPAHFYGRMVDSIVKGSYCLGGGGGTVQGTVVGSTIIGNACFGQGGLVLGTFVRNTIVGDSCVGGDSGTIKGLFVGNTIAGNSCFGGIGGDIDGRFEGNIIYGMYCVGGDSGTVKGEFIGNTIAGTTCFGSYGNVDAKITRCDITGPWHMDDVTYSANTVFSYCSGLNSAITSTSAHLIYCINQNNNPISNQ